MGILALDHVSVWLDYLAPGGAFAHALEWAGRLGLPLHAMSSTRRPEVETLSGDVWAETLSACAEACHRKGVPWGSPLERGTPGSGVEKFLGPAGLGVFADNLPSPVLDHLLREALGRPDAPVLICSRSWQPVSRVLVVCQKRDAGDLLLERAAEVCRAFRVTPVVLSVAGSEREARRRRRQAEETFAAWRQPADFDFVAGCDVRTAVACVARWRRCSHVFVERPRGPVWWRRLCGETPADFLGVSEALAVLALPGGPGARPGPAAERRRADTALSEAANPEVRT